MKKRLFFGRVKSRKLSSSNILLTNNFLKKFTIKKNIFRKKKIVIEIGHGMGEAVRGWFCTKRKSASAMKYCRIHNDYPTPQNALPIIFWWGNLYPTNSLPQIKSMELFSGRGNSWWGNRCPQKIPRQLIG